MKRLLAVVDMQNDFVTGALGTEEAQKIVPAVQQLLKRERAANTDVVFTQDTHGEDYLNTQEGKYLPVPHCIRKTEGWKILEGLDVRGARIFEKGTFGSVELARYAAEGNYSEIVFCGVCTDICVVNNALLVKAFCPEATVYAVASACAGTSVQAHEAALMTMQSCQIQVLR